MQLTDHELGSPVIERTKKFQHSVKHYDHFQ